ncbi:MAG: RAD55 family ATPase, partial [Thermoplasmatota archaeon]
MTRELTCFGIEALDELVGSDITRGSVINITGPPGTGKTLVSLSFISEGLEGGEAGLHVSFTSVPLVNVIKDLKDIERLQPLFSTDEPMIMDLLDLRRSELLIG